MKPFLRRLWHALCLAAVAFRVGLRGWTVHSWGRYREPLTGHGDYLATVDYHHWGERSDASPWGWRVSSGPYTYGVSYRSPLKAIRAAERRLARRAAREAHPS